MADSYVYIVVEGIHDAAFLRKLLSLDSFTAITKSKNVDEFWRRLIPKAFYDDDLLARVRVPFFVAKDNVSVSIQVAKGGITSIPTTIHDDLKLLEAELRKPNAIGVVLDADLNETPSERWRELALLLTTQLAQFGVNFPVQPGVVASTEAIRTGGYVIPDNTEPGTLEDILLDCADIVYKELSAAARQYVASVDNTWASKADLQELRKPAGKQKAVVSSIASILKPGKAIQVSIQDNQWLSPQTLEEPKVKTLQQFLRDLIEY